MKLSETIELLGLSCISFFWAVVCGILAGNLVSSSLEAQSWLSVVFCLMMAGIAGLAAYHCFCASIHGYERWMDRKIEKQKRKEAADLEARNAMRSKNRKQSDFEDWAQRIEKIREKGF